MTSPLRVIPAVAALGAAVLFVSLFAPLAAAQGTGTIGGRVTDGITGRPVDGVQVYVAGTELGTVTNADGRYQLNLPAGTAELRTRRVGYATIVRRVTVVPGEARDADFQLRQAAIGLDAVVVTGAGAQTEKRKLGNTVVTIDAAQLHNAPTATFSEQLAARDAAVAVLPSGGLTGEGARIRIRTAASLTQPDEPVVYVDVARVDRSGGFGDNIGPGGLGRRGADLLEAGSAGRAALGHDDLARLLHLPAVALRSRGGVRPVADVAGLRGRQPAGHGTVPNDHARGRPPEPVLRHHHTAVPGVRAQLSEGTVRDRLRRHLLGLGKRRHAGGDVLRERALLCRERAVRRRAARSRCGHRPQGTRGRVARDPADRSPQAAPHHPVHRCAPRDAEQQQQHLCAANKRDLQPPGARDLRDAPSHRPALAADRTRGLHRSRQSDGRAVIRYRA